MDPAGALRELQSRELDLARLTKQLDEMPEKRAILQIRAKIVEIRGLRARTEAVVHSLDASVKRHEDEAQAVADKIDVEQAKLLSGRVKSPKELQAISLELGSLKRRMDQLETEMLAQMQKSETAAGQTARVDAALLASQAKEAELTRQFKERGSELLARIEADSAARCALLEALPGDLRGRYEAALTSKRGIAVGILHEGMCSACRVGLPAGKIDALEHGPDISTCPDCGRILIVRSVE
jgi:predicted  nucleic acid-binding Zn-ribbon protein